MQIMRALVASDDQAMAQRVRAVLVEHGADCPAGHLVSLDSVADRSGLIHPELVVFVMPSDWPRGLSALLETRNTIPRMHALVMGPATDPKRILETLKQGADEFLDREIAESELSGALDRFRTVHQQLDANPHGGRVIAVVSPCGGCGASMLAASVSTVLAQEHGQAGLIDLRLGVADLSAMLDLRPTRTLADLCDHVARLDQSLFEQFLTRHNSGVQLLAAPVQDQDIQRVTAKGVRRALALARVRFPSAVVDMGSTLGAEQIEALWQADAVLLVVRLDYTSIRNARRSVDAMTDLGIARDRMRLVLNCYGQRRQLEVEQAEAAIGMKAVHRVPYDAAAVNLAVNGGIPVVLKCRFSRITKSLRALAHSVNGVKK
jgi:pilus assembly protein CpaE